MCIFPENKGFKYNSDYDEWRLYFDGFYLVLWKKINDGSLWVLSKVDSEDYITEIETSYNMIKSIDTILRDIKLDSILNKQNIKYP